MIWDHVVGVQLPGLRPISFRGIQAGKEAHCYCAKRRFESCPRSHALLAQWQSGRLTSDGWVFDSLTGYQLHVPFIAEVVQWKDAGL